MVLLSGIPSLAGRTVGLFVKESTKLEMCEVSEDFKEHTEIKQHNKEASGVKDNKDETAKEVEGNIDNNTDKDSQMEELDLNDLKRNVDK